MKATLILSQVLWSSGTRQSDTSLIYIFIGIAGLVLVAALINYALKREARGVSLSRGQASYSKSSFRRAARVAGLLDEEIRYLEGVAKALSVTNPDFIFKNQAKLDSFFKDVYRYIEKNSDSEAAAEEQKAVLFAARERITHRNSLGAPVSSSRQLGRNMPLTFIAPGEESYPSVIVAVEPGGLAVEPVHDAYGEPLRFRRGTKLTCYFYAQGHQGYQFPTKVGGWERIGDKEVMVLAHSDSVAALPARRFARREMSAPCTFYRMAVTVNKTRGKEQSSAKVENIPYPGTIVDISAGGLGIQSANPLAAGEFIKIEFTTGTGTLAAFAKVLRMNKARARGGVMHLQFVKISRRTLNAIMSYVYGYSD
jgi:c-di-GMP-binding flagellar brake protein YcgR